jgi:nucleoside-diphosphate-sugar epimerase
LQTEILDPAIKGTLNVLRACKKNPMIRRVVLTSSSSTIRVREDSDQDKVLDETCWSSVELCQRLQVRFINISNEHSLLSYRAFFLVFVIPKETGLMFKSE